MTTTDDGTPTVTSAGSAPNATVKVSSSSSASLTVAIVPVPLVCPPAIATLASEPKSPSSAVPAVSPSGIVTEFGNAAERRTVTVTGCPSSTGFGDAARLTVGSGGGCPSSLSVIVNV